MKKISVGVCGYDFSIHKLTRWDEQDEFSSSHLMTCIRHCYFARADLETSLRCCSSSEAFPNMYELILTLPHLSSSVSIYISLMLLFHQRCIQIYATIMSSIHEPTRMNIRLKYSHYVFKVILLWYNII